MIQNYPPVAYRIQNIVTDGTYVYKDVLKAVATTPQQEQNLAEATKDQANSALWKAHRKGRITASNSYRILNFRAPASVLRKIMQYDCSDLSWVPSIKWGVSNEANAKDQYCKYMEGKHKNFQFENTGLHLFTDCPFIACSPDGLARCDCHGIFLVEVKCPFKYKDVMPTHPTALQDTQYCLDGQGNLKQKHPYYCQVQTQMLVTSVEVCDLVIWTSSGMHIISVPRDCDYINSLKLKLTDFVTEHLIPEIIHQKLQRINEANEFNNPSTSVCSCQRPAFGKMIVCGNEECMVEKYHYECVGITRKPNNLWLCPDCAQ